MSQRNVINRSDEIDKIEALRSENFELKRQLSNTKTENHKLKVKVRKLQEDLSKRQKQIYNLVDPKKSQAFRKFISENGATLFLSLKEQKDELIKLLVEKDNQIRKLQSDLQLTKSYIVTEKRRSYIDERQNKPMPPPLYYEKNEQTNNTPTHFKSSSMSELKKINIYAPAVTLEGESVRPKSSNEAIQSSTHSSTIDADDLEQLNFNLQKIRINSLAKITGVDTKVSNDVPVNIHSGYSSPIHKEVPSFESPSAIVRHTNHVVTRSASPRKIQHSPIRKDSPESDIDRIELGCETPHQEIQQLQSYFLEMLDEVGNLRSTIQQLQSDQAKTNTVLRDKEECIEELAEEIETLKSSSILVSATPLSKKKKPKKVNYERRSTGTSCLNSNSRQMGSIKDEIKKIKDYLYKNDDSSDNSSTAMATYNSQTQTDSQKGVYKILRKPSTSSKYSQDSHHLFVDAYPQTTEERF